MANVTTGANAQDILLIDMGGVLKVKTRGWKDMEKGVRKKKEYFITKEEKCILGAKKDRVLN